MIRHHGIRAGLILLAACGAGGAKTFPDGKTVEFYGILVDVPAGTSWGNSGSHLPMEYEGAPTEVTPGITFIHPNTHDLYVEIKKLPAPLSLEGMKLSLGQQPQHSDLTGHTTAGGWDLEDRWKHDDASVSTMYVRYLQLGGDQYECDYDDGSSQKPDVAEKIYLPLDPAQAGRATPLIASSRTRVSRPAAR